MPIEEFAAKDNYAVSPSLPMHLDHQPVYAMPYKQFDGWRAGNTDTRYLSIGISQWSADEISLKIMRHKDKWSRQSEELPLHRVVDSSIFLAKVLLDRHNESIDIEPDLFTNQSHGFRIHKEPITHHDKDQFENAWGRHEPALKDRFDTLYRMLAQLKAQGKF
ncbi:hypothetical protein PS876_04112 [Pseudomonas fluorescens]|uniref:DUF6530 family protein n=1 Tax=Pseudomonas fluorescens TaxID=294 RepID=UPI00124020EF|nr:DUF6530 family protein [Pseudomonas fluorescens]VVP26553.1 hypothetical protein PS876_04112 [Pseudomonas fluorescens]